MATSLSSQGSRRFGCPTRGQNSFYRHDRLPGLDVKGGKPARIRYVDRELNVLIHHTDDTYSLHRTDGLRTTFSFGRLTDQQRLYVASEVADGAGNNCFIRYEPNWWLDYPEHPVVSSISDEENRSLQFSYVIVGNRKRLSRITLSHQVMASYSYRTEANFVHLHQHSTPAGRTTSYTYHMSGRQFEALKSIVLPTGGTYHLSYEAKFFFFPGERSETLAVTRIQKDHDSWSLAYPTEAPSSGDFVVSTVGPGGYRESQTFYGYARGAHGQSPGWQIGLLKKSVKALGDSTKTKTRSYEEFPVSYGSLWSICPGGTPRGGSIDRGDGDAGRQTLQTRYADFDWLSPRLTTGPGGQAWRRSYTHLFAPNGYRLSLLTDDAYSVGGDLLARTSMGGYTAQQVPTTVRAYRTAMEGIAMHLRYHDQPGKRGALASREYGGYRQDYDYRYGRLSRIGYPIGAPDTHDVHANGTVASQVIDGVKTAFSYDHDGRLTWIAPALDAATHFSYAINALTIASGQRHTEHQLDAWGRIAQTSSWGDGPRETSHFAYDGHGQRVSETTPLGAHFEMSYDVYGRQKYRRSAEERLAYRYCTDGRGTTVYTTKNGSISYKEKSDFAVRILEGSVNGQAMSTSYAGTMHTHQTQGQTAMPIG